MKTLRRRRYSSTPLNNSYRVGSAIPAPRVTGRSQEPLKRPTHRRQGQPRLGGFRRGAGLFFLGAPVWGECGLRAQAFKGQEAVGQHHQRGMAVKAVPGPAFKMVQAQLLFHLLVTLLDGESGGAKAARPAGNSSWPAGC